MSSPESNDYKGAIPGNSFIDTDTNAISAMTKELADGAIEKAGSQAEIDAINVKRTVLDAETARTAMQKVDYDAYVASIKAEDSMAKETESGQNSYEAYKASLTGEALYNLGIMESLIALYPNTLKLVIKPGEKPRAIVQNPQNMGNYSPDYFCYYSEDGISTFDVDTGYRDNEPFTAEQIRNGDVLLMRSPESKGEGTEGYRVVAKSGENIISNDTGHNLEVGHGWTYSFSGMPDFRIKEIKQSMTDREARISAESQAKKSPQDVVDALT